MFLFFSFYFFYSIHLFKWHWNYQQCQHERGVCLVFFWAHYISCKLICLIYLLSMEHMRLTITIYLYLLYKYEEYKALVGLGLLIKNVQNQNRRIQTIQLHTENR